MKPRYHARFPGALCEGLTALGPGAQLAAYRLEPVRTIDGPQHYLDLTFAAGESIGVVAGIRVDRIALVQRDRSPFVAPREARAVAARLAEAFDAVEPALRAAFTAAGDPRELLHAMPGVAEAAIASRRAARALGAAPYADVVRARGRAVEDGAYVETIFGGDVPAATSRSGGTAGDAPLRCYVAVSDDALASGGAAYQAALAIAAALGGDELAVDVAGYDGRPLSPYAFVHAVGVDDPEPAAELLAAARAAGIRTLLTPLFDDPALGGFWGARTHARLLRNTDDEDVLAPQLGWVVSRALVLDDDIAYDKPWEPRPGYREAQRSAFSLADVVLVATAAEANRIRGAGVDRVFSAYVPVPFTTEPPEASAAPYVLAVAPVGALHASATLARAAARVGLPVRFTGTVLDGAYAARARAYLDDRSSFAPGDPGRGARVVADVSWSGTDLGALASHAAHGVPIVGSNRAGVRDVFGGNNVWEVDPADETAIGSALADAWNGGAGNAAVLAAHVNARCRADVLRACLAAAYRAPERVA